jgi:membrane protease YdiL (CAAX protease family)
LFEPEQHVPLPNESQPRLSELLAIVAIGVAHVCIELVASVDATRVYNVAAGIAVIAYLIWRATTTNSILRVWGMRRDNFWPALRVQLIFGVPAAACLILLGLVNRTVPLPRSFWLVCALYPLFGVAQQFVLQNLLARNLTKLVPHRMLLAFVSALLFSLSHFPRLSLSVLALIGGFFLTLIYRRHPNLWAAGIVHGILAGLAFYVVLQEDPGARIIQFLMR